MSGNAVAKRPRQAQAAPEQVEPQDRTELDDDAAHLADLIARLPQPAEPPLQHPIAG